MNTGCYNQTTYDDGRRRRLSRRRLSSCSHGNVGTRPISRSYGLLDDNVFSLAAANGWLPPSDLPTRIPFLSHPAHWDARVQVQAHMTLMPIPLRPTPRSTPRSRNPPSPTMHCLPPPPLLLPPTPPNSSPSPRPGPRRAAPQPAHAPGRDASLALVAELRAHAAECRVPHHLAVKVDTGRDTGRITGAVLFFIAFKASRY